MIITGSKLAQICGVSRQAISKLNLPKKESGKYDTTNNEIKKYLISKGINLSIFKNEVLPDSKKQKPKKTKPKLKSRPKPKAKPKTTKLKTEVKPKAEKPKKQTNKNIKTKKLQTTKVFPNIETEESDSEIIKPFENKNNITDDEFEDITGLPAKMMKLNLMNLVKKYGGPYQLDKWATILQKLMTAQKADVAVQRERLTLIEKDFTISNVFKYIEVLMSQLFDLAESQSDQIIDIVKSDPEGARKYIQELRLKGYSKIAKETKKSIIDSLERMKEKYENKNDSES